jgi:hypothetical protein
MAEHSIAPWTLAEVESLNAFQAAGVTHPFTCPHDRWCEHDVLVATEAGWICGGCDYTQDWAHVFMADGSWREAFPEHPLGALRRLADV